MGGGCLAHRQLPCQGAVALAAGSVPAGGTSTGVAPLRDWPQAGATPTSGRQSLASTAPCGRRRPPLQVGPSCNQSALASGQAVAGRPYRGLAMAATLVEGLTVADHPLSMLPLSLQGVRRELIEGIIGLSGVNRKLAEGIKSLLRVHRELAEGNRELTRMALGVHRKKTKRLTRRSSGLPKSLPGVRRVLLDLMVTLIVID
ncbi:hypothetical protein B296_00015111 [Ensete ventricosum]|uniref:Uncharacterized protein n=1 Tax=Ensete ventricosum TaxID=4639 RepID=A0A426Y665_ENSVE|nr:hypothetical protein B296_00015111 [Ensete ventricosum]